MLWCSSMVKGVGVEEEENRRERKGKGKLGRVENIIIVSFLCSLILLPPLVLSCYYTLVILGHIQSTDDLFIRQITARARLG